MSTSVTIKPTGTSSVEVTLEDGSYTVIVEWQNQNDQSVFSELTKTPYFIEWLGGFAADQLKKINILHLSKTGDQVLCVLDAVTDFGGVEGTTGPVFLRPNGSGLLIIIRVTGERVKDYIILKKTKPATIAGQECLEILRGIKDGDNYVGEDMEKLKDLTKMTVSGSQVDGTLVDLNEVGYQGKIAVTHPDLCTGHTRLFVYRKGMNDEEFTAFKEAISEESNPQSPFVAVTISEGWRRISDTTSMAALFLFHESRYHSVMPRLRLDGPVVYTKVSKLQPHGAGLHLVVKVAKAMEVPPADKEGSPKGRESQLVVGDDTGTVNFCVTGNQRAVKGLTEVGSRLLIHNARIDMREGFMHLVVPRTGRITSEVDEPDFELDSSEEHNVSTTAYELVPEAPASPARRFRGGRRGRGGFRG